MTAKPKWGSESDMLDVVIGAARARGWRAVSECCGHDLVLVVSDGHYSGDLAQGDQIAVEGKLRDSVEVLRQALPCDRRAHANERGADWYAVAVPSPSADFDEVAAALGILVVAVPAPDPEPRPGRYRMDADVLAPLLHAPAGLRRTGGMPLDVPGLDVVQRAGEPAPRALTPWKIAAVRLCLLAESRGGVLTTNDFRGTPVRLASFGRNGWLDQISREGRVTTYRLLDAPGRPDRCYPEIADALRRDPSIASAVTWKDDR